MAEAPPGATATVGATPSCSTSAAPSRAKPSDCGLLTSEASTARVACSTTPTLAYCPAGRGTVTCSASAPAGVSYTVTPLRTACQLAAVFTRTVNDPASCRLVVNESEPPLIQVPEGATTEATTLALRASAAPGTAAAAANVGTGAQ